MHEKVDEAFTASGKKRTGQASPWARIRGQRVTAEANERVVRQQLEESESARVRTERLHEKLLAAESKRQGADRALAGLEAALERRKAREAAETALAAAEAECGRVQGLFDRRDRNAAAVAEGAERVSELDKARAEAEAAAESRRLQVEAAREQVRRLETGAGEQQRRLREEEAKNRRLELKQSQQGHEQKVAGAEALARREEEITALAADIDKRETELKEREGLLRDARVAADRGRDAIGALEVERQCARYLGAVGAARASAAALDAAREHARQAAELERRAVATREEAADLHAPAGAELDRLRSVETAWRIAREKLAVGLAVEVALERGVSAEIGIDGQSRQVPIEGGEPAAFEAQRELRLDLVGIGVVHVRGGGRDLLRDAAAAEDDWNREAPPVFARAGCATLPALEALRTRAAGLLETASGLERQAEQERARAEGLDELERRAVVAKAEVEPRRAARRDPLQLPTQPLHRPFLVPHRPRDRFGHLRRQQRHHQLPLVRIDPHVGDRLAHDRLPSSAALTPLGVNPRIVGGFGHLVACSRTTTARLRAGHSISSKGDLGGAVRQVGPGHSPTAPDDYSRRDGGQPKDRVADRPRRGLAPRRRSRSRRPSGRAVCLPRKGLR